MGGRYDLPSLSDSRLSSALVVAIETLSRPRDEVGVHGVLGPVNRCEDDRSQLLNNSASSPCKHTTYTRINTNSPSSYIQYTIYTMIIEIKTPSSHIQLHDDH